MLDAWDLARINLVHEEYMPQPGRLDQSPKSGHFAASPISKVRRKATFFAVPEAVREFN